MCVIGKCKSIQILDLTRTAVTYEGITKALEHLPSLRKLKHRQTIRVLAQIYKRAVDEKLSDIPKFTLSSIQITNFRPKWNRDVGLADLGLAVHICPLITELYIHSTLSNITDNDLLGLLPLEKLEHFYISIRLNANFTFDGSLTPFLKATGNSLKELTINMVLEVDYIPTITRHCSNLRSLGLYFNHTRLCSVGQRNSFSRNRTKLERPILNYLEILNLVEPRSIGLIHPESLCLLLSSPSLKSISISSCDTLTDDVLHEAANLHLFNKLETFDY
jgi:hypothetical protein